MTKLWLAEGACTKCNFMRRTDPNGYCPWHRPPEKFRERYEWYQNQFPGQKFELLLETHDWGHDEYVRVLAVAQFSVGLLRNNGVRYWQSPTLINNHLGPKKKCKTNWPVPH